MSARTMSAALAVGICSMLLLVTFVAAPVAAQAKDKTLDVNFTQKVGPIEIAIEDLGLDYEELAELVGMLPEDAQQFLVHVDSIYIDGMVHINLEVWDSGRDLAVHLQAFWHGTIELLDDEGNVLIGLDAKNVQILAHAEMQACDLSEIEVFANVHLNGALYTEMCGDLSLDVMVHLLVRWDDGGLTLFKLWLPDLGDLAIV